MKLALLGLTTSLAACGVTSSEDVKTSGIWASMGATATGDGNTIVGATLFLGNPLQLIFVDLTGEDRLIAHHEGESKTMSEFQLLTIVTHEASFPIDQPDSVFEIEFSRAGDDDAPSSIASIPEPFELAPGPTTASRAADLTLSWTGVAPEPMDWDVTGTCIQSVGGQITEDTTVTIPANTIKKVDDPMSETSCQVTLSVWRRRAGELDPAFKDGSMSGNQRRQLTFTSTP